MKNSFSNETIHLVWDLIHNQNKKLKDVAKELGSSTDRINAIYNEAVKRFGKRTPIRRHVVEVAANKQPPTHKRPPAVYSNKSPYGIAMPGIKR